MEMEGVGTCKRKVEEVMVKVAVVIYNNKEVMIHGVEVVVVIYSSKEVVIRGVEVVVVICKCKEVVEEMYKRKAVEVEKYKCKACDHRQLHW